MSPGQTTRVLSLWAPVVGLMVVIFWLSSQPVLPIPPGGLSDKQAHGLAYGALAALAYRALAQGLWSGLTASRALAAVAIASAYGVFDEWHQSFVHGRMSEFADLVADVLGALCAGAVLWGCGIIAARRHSRNAGTSH